MPEGQFSGSKCTYEYTNDEGTNFLLTLDQTLGDLSGNGLVLATQESTAVPKPTGFQPRIVFWQSLAPVGTNRSLSRKELVVGDLSADYYATSVSQMITIDGVEGRTTGRRGEKLSFANICQTSS